MKNIFLVINLFICILGSAQEDTLMQTANKLYIDQDYLSAAKLYKQVYSLDTTDIEPAIKSANALYLLGNTKEAKDYLNSLLEKTKDTFSGYKVLSKIYETDGNVPLTIKAYRYLIKKDSLNLSNRKNLARIYMNNKLYLDAKRQHIEILKLNENDINTYINLAEVNISLKQNGEVGLEGEAGRIIDHVISIDSTNINARKLRARLFYEAKAYSETVNDLEYVNKVTDMTEYYYNMLGVCYMYLDSFDLAEEYITKSFGVKEYKEYGYYYIGTMAEKKGDLVKAEANYYMAIEEGISKYTDTYYKRLMELYVEKTQYNEALIAIDKALSFNQHRPEYVYLKAMVHDYKEEGSIAIEQYKKYCEITANEGKYTTKSKERIKYLEVYLSKKRMP
jgi:Tfp pilus assembly protein PilF